MKEHLTEKDDERNNINEKSEEVGKSTSAPVTFKKRKRAKDEPNAASDHLQKSMSKEELSGDVEVRELKRKKTKEMKSTNSDSTTSSLAIKEANKGKIKVESKIVKPKFKREINRESKSEGKIRLLNQINPVEKTTLSKSSNIEKESDFNWDVKTEINPLVDTSETSEIRKKKKKKGSDQHDAIVLEKTLEKDNFSLLNIDKTTKSLEIDEQSKDMHDNEGDNKALCRFKAERRIFKSENRNDEISDDSETGELKEEGELSDDSTDENDSGSSIALSYGDEESEVSDVEVEEDIYWLSKLLIELSEDPVFRCRQCQCKFGWADLNPERRPVRSECSHSFCKTCASKEIIKYTTENNVEEIKDGDKSHSLKCCKCGISTKLSIMLTRPSTGDEIQYKRDMQIVMLMMNVCEIELPSRGTIGENEYFELLKKLAETGPNEFKRLVGQAPTWDKLKKRNPYLKNMTKAEGTFKFLVQEIPIHFRSLVDDILNEEMNVDSVKNVTYIDNHMNFNEALEEIIQRIDRKLEKEIRDSASYHHLLEMAYDENSCFRSKYCPDLLDVRLPLVSEQGNEELLVEEKVDIKTEKV